MSPEPIYLRFENTSPPHRKFYEIEVELSLFYPKRLVRRWGRIGARRPRTIRKVVSSPDDLVRQVRTLVRRRAQHGYQAVTQVHSPAIGAAA